MQPYLDNLKNDPCAMDVDSFQYEDTYVIDNKEMQRPNPNSCWQKFLGCIRSLWATKHTENTKTDRQLYIKTTLRELVIYILFIIILMIISFGMTNIQSYWFTNLLNVLFRSQSFNDNTGSFINAQTELDFWKFLTGPLINGLYWKTWYNNVKNLDTQRNFIYSENKLVGLPRMRQLRVGNASCQIPKDFRSEIKQCFAIYSPSTESRVSFGLQNSTAWIYTNESETKAGSFEGQISTYPGGGFYTDFASTRNETLEIISNLFKNLWIDRATRAVIVDFTIYNANINLFCSIKLVTEFPATGGLITSSEFRTVKLIRYVYPMDFFVLGCEILFLLFIIYYIIEEILEIKMLQFEYFFSFWNILDILVVLFSLICSTFNIYRTLTVQKDLRILVSMDNQHPNFESLSYWQLQFNYLIAITLFLAWVKIFKYISFNKTMAQLSSTLNKCSKDLAGFTIMFSIIFLAFSQLGYLIFGAQLADFSQLQNCIYTLFRIILGDFDFAQLEMAHRILGPLYFVFYVFFVFFVLFNMFLAIITDTYSDVKEEMANKKNEFEIADYLKERTEIILKKLHLKKEKIIDLQNALKNADINNDGVMDFNEWKTEMKLRGYNDREIESVFAKYDTDGNRFIDEKEQLIMEKELEDMKNSISNKIEKNEMMKKSVDEQKLLCQSVSMEEYRTLNRRVDHMDNNTRCIVSKIDSVLVNLENLEKSKSSSREAMGIILKTLTMSSKLSEDERKQKLESLIQNEITKLSQNSKRPNSSFGSRTLGPD